MTEISLVEAQANLADLVHRLAPGDEVLITENNQPVAKIVLATNLTGPVRELGTMRGTVVHMASDFDAPIDDFEGAGL